jgi:hypothetical protein
MIDPENLIMNINRLRPFEVKHDDAYAHGQNDTIDRVIAIIQHLVKNQEKGE